MRKSNKHRSRIPAVLSTLVMIIAIGALSLPADSGAAADPCGRENQVDCINQALQNLQDCIGSPGYCADQFDRDYTGCMVLKGCASPPPPQM